MMGEGRCQRSVCLSLHAFVSTFFFFILATLRHMELLGQGSDSSHSLDLSHNCGNARSPTHWARQGMELESQCSQDATDPAEPQREFLLLFLETLFHNV